MLFPIRLFGDPVLRTPAAEVVEIDDNLAKLAEDMIETMYDAPGVGLAAPQVGVPKRMFVYDIDDGSGPHVVVNPTLTAHRGDWAYAEGCLSVPGLHWDIVRPDYVHLTGWALDGREISMEGDGLLGRVFQHEVDHLDGILLIERLDPAQRREAMRTMRERTLDLSQ